MTNIAWIDVETTGLDAHEDHLLEIAVVVTDPNLNTLDERGFHAVVSYPWQAVDKMKAEAGEYVREMHTKTGLWKRLEGHGALPLHAIDVDLEQYLSAFGKPKTMPVAGNSVRLDMNFIDQFLPETSAFLDYHMRDVSTIAGLASDWYDQPWFEKHNDHTAMTDIRESIRELKHYREAIFKPVKEVWPTDGMSGAEMLGEVSETTTRDEVTRVLAENGLSENFELHSWRCQHPDRYGPCTCVAELIDDLMKVIKP